MPAPAIETPIRLKTEHQYHKTPSSAKHLKIAGIGRNGRRIVPAAWLVWSDMPTNERYDRKIWAPGSLLSSLSGREQEIVLALGRTRQYNGGEVIFHQGDGSNFVAIIIDGYVKISAVTDDGAETLLAIRMAGDVVGELAAMDGFPRSATAQAADAVLARIITKPELDRCLEAHFTIGRAFNQAVSAKLRMATRRRVDFRRDTRSRLAQVLVDLYHGSVGTRRSDTNALVITQAELAALIGASEPAVHKALRTLREAHVVSTRYGRMVIENIAALRRIAEGREPGICAKGTELHIFTMLFAALPADAAHGTGRWKDDSGWAREHPSMACAGCASPSI